MREIEDIHIPFLAWLHELDIPLVYHRPDRKSGIQTGWPDFTVAYARRVVFIEAKTPEGRLSEVQRNVHKFIRKAGNIVVVCRSLEECKEAVREFVLWDGLTEAFSPQLNAAPVLADACKRADLIQNRQGGEARESTSGVDSGHHSCGGVQFYIIEWCGITYVVAPAQLGAGYEWIREASAIDRVTLPRLPA